MPATEGDAIETIQKAGYQDVLAAPPHIVAQVVDGCLHMQCNQGRSTGMLCRARR